MSAPDHLKRLVWIWEKQPVYFITTCISRRRSILACQVAHDILRAEWVGMRDRHGWAVGRYVIMHDHVHFFVAPIPDDPRPLSKAVGKWKEWTAKRILSVVRMERPIWQPEFFDHLLRSNESRAEKWNYVRENPVRAGLVNRADDWPYAGTIDFD